MSKDRDRIDDERRVGIFSLVDNDRLFVDSTPLSNAEPYGDCLTHPHGHIDQWETLQTKGTVPPFIDYEESPRGRVTYNRKTARFTLLVDRCILTSGGNFRPGRSGDIPDGASRTVSPFMTSYGTASNRVLRLRQVKNMLGLSKTTIYARIGEGTFPRPISLGGRSVGWLESEVNAWLNERIAASRGQSAASAA